jgi:hypothetical protein
VAFADPPLHIGLLLDRQFHWELFCPDAQETTDVLHCLKLGHFNLTEPE